jgi:uncharacterized surface protein with fasciclin (FAS1) repeats
MKFSVFALIAAALSKTALDVVLESPDHKTLAKLAATIPDVVNVLKSAGPLTLFAPNDAAFAKLDKAVTEAVTSDPVLLAQVLKYHVIDGSAFDPAKAAPKQFPETVLKQRLSVSVDTVDKERKVTLAFGLGTSKVVNTAATDNGVVHIVDTVLIPLPSASKLATDAALTQLVAALSKAKLVETVDSRKEITIFAPTDKAFADLVAFAEKNKLTIDDALLKQVLETHVVPSVVFSTDIIGAKTPLKAAALSKQPITAQLKDGSVLVSGEGNATPAKVVNADVLFNNGVAHVIDTVLLPKLPTASKPQPVKETAKDYKPTPTQAAQPYYSNIVSGAVSQGFLMTSLIAALTVF